MLIGHDNMKCQLEVAIEASRMQNKAVPHVLFSGAAGCGKTSSAHWVAEKLGCPFLAAVPNDMKDKKSVFSLLDKLDHSGYDERGNRVSETKPTILFFDEIHDMPTRGQELLGLIMERFIIESSVPNKFHWVPFFTLVGATTLAGQLTKPFRDRFKLNFQFQPYDLENMVEIILFHCNRLNVRTTRPAALEIAKRSRGTPRIAVGYVERIRDKMLVTDAVVATVPLVLEAFRDLKIDSSGFTDLELRILKALFEANAPVSLDNMAVMVQEDKKSIKDFAEPYLIMKGMILVSGKGRVITEKGAKYLNDAGQTSRIVKELVDFDYVRM